MGGTYADATRGGIERRYLRPDVIQGPVGDFGVGLTAVAEELEREPVGGGIEDGEELLRHVLIMC